MPASEIRMQVPFMAEERCWTNADTHTYGEHKRTKANTGGARADESATCEIINKFHIIYSRNVCFTTIWLLVLRQTQQTVKICSSSRCVEMDGNWQMHAKRCSICLDSLGQIALFFCTSHVLIFVCHSSICIRVAIHLVVPVSQAAMVMHHSGLWLLFKFPQLYFHF